MKITIAPGTYVIGETTKLLPDDVPPLTSVPVENGTYKDQFGTTYRITSGRIGISHLSIVQRPHLFKDAIKNNTCCGRQVNGADWILGWWPIRTKEFGVLHSFKNFVVENDTIIKFGPLVIEASS